MMNGSSDAKLSRFEIDLPLVPSLNNAYSNGHRGRYMTASTKAWKIAAGWIVKAANPPKFKGPYKFTVLVPQNMRGDCDNRIKLASDLLSKDLGVLPDDANAVETTCRRDPDIKRGECRLIVEAA